MKNRQAFCFLMTCFMFAGVKAAATAGSLGRGAPTRLNMQVITTADTMVTVFEQEFQQELSPAEKQAVRRFAEVVSSESSNNLLHSASTRSDADQVSVLFCLSGKGAIIIRLGAGFCVSPSGRGYIVSFIGDGLSVGIAATGTVLIHKGNPAQIRGEYKGLTGGGFGIELFAQHLGRYANVLRFFGGEIQFMRNERTQEPIFIFGASYGPMVDFAKSAMTIE